MIKKLTFTFLALSSLAFSAVSFAESEQMTVTNIVDCRVGNFVAGKYDMVRIAVTRTYKNQDAIDSAMSRV